MRAKKIVKALAKPDAFKEGRNNFKRPNEQTESLAKERFKNHCKGCVHLEDETVDLFKVTDKIIPEASEKYCGDCGCILSYKIRQNIEICNKWQK